MWNLSLLREQLLKRNINPFNASKEEILLTIKESKIGSIHGGWPEWRDVVFHKDRRVSPGFYNLSEMELSELSEPNKTELFVNEDVPAVQTKNCEISYIPRRNPNYIMTGYFKSIRAIINSKLFMPTYVTGLTGMGKTETIVQAAAMCKRELIRVNITSETSERHLIGGMRLINGETQWEDGPALIAMKRGAILLLDEVDLGSEKVLCLQSIMEGSDYVNKETKELVRPAHGFTIFATANTKGAASSKYYGTRPLNEAFFDRFDTTIEQTYPTPEEEGRILMAYFKSIANEKTFERFQSVIHYLPVWSKTIRDSFFNGSVSDIVSTRRLKSFIKSLVVHQKVNAALKDCLARFQDAEKKSFERFFLALMKEEDIKKIDLDNDEGEVDEVI